MVKEWTITAWEKHALNPQGVIPVDVRSPSEYHEAHLPQAISLPLFNDDERARIGTIYKKVGQAEAKWAAMQIVSPKIPALLEVLKGLNNRGETPLIYCWRGGTRSGSVATFAELAGLEVLRLQGGFRAYREWCVAQLDHRWLVNKRPIVIHGMTGVGKSELLFKLKEDGYPTLDLEMLANHRGSVFGEIGLGTPHHQKQFDSLLALDLIKHASDTSLILEAESKRIGRAVLPDAFLAWKDHGLHIILETCLEYRVERIYKDYVHPYHQEEWFQAKVLEAFKPIEKRFSYEKVLLLKQALTDKDYKVFIHHLLEWYYDPRYTFHFMAEKYTGDFERVSFHSLEEALQQVKAILAKHQIFSTQPLLL